MRRWDERTSPTAGAPTTSTGVAARRSAALAATALAQGVGLVVVALAVPFFPGEPLLLSEAGWGAGAGLTGAVGVALLYYGLAVGRVSVVAPVTAVCAIAIPVVVAGAMGERPGPLAGCGIGAAAAFAGPIIRCGEQAGASSPGEGALPDRVIGRGHL